MVPAGQTTNSKIASDIKAFLESSGIPSSHVDVAIKGPYVPSNPPIFDLPDFDLDSAANDSKLVVVEAKVVSLTFMARHTILPTQFPTPVSHALSFAMAKPLRANSRSMTLKRVALLPFNLRLVAIHFRETTEPKIAAPNRSEFGP